MRRVCLVGAGYISGVHAEALRDVPRTRLAVVVDPDTKAAERLARIWNIEGVFRSVEQALAAGGFDCAHVATPPPAHRDAALPLLAAGLPVLVEKPLATSRAECAELLAAARASGATLGVNQNFVYHPAFARLRHLLRSGALGRPQAVSGIYNMPLRQMAARQFGHWMFCAPGNLLLEQAVHPLSQIAAVAGAAEEVQALAGPAIAIAPSLPLYPRLDLLLRCRDLPAQLNFAVGQSFPFWQLTVTCSDGVVVADMLGNRLLTHARTRWPEELDAALAAARLAGAALRDGGANLGSVVLSTLSPRRRRNPFFSSMRASIAAFHAALDAKATPELDGAFGAALVAACEMASRGLPGAAPMAARPAGASRPDVAILGGTGFIGTHVVRRYLQAGQRVAVLARSIRNLPAPFDSPHVVLHQGEIRDAASVARAIGEATVVVNLAHGGGGGSFAEIREAMVGGAETVARACLANGVRRLLHIGSIAALYLGPQAAPVTGATPPDPRSGTRADYARAKALCEQLLLEMHALQGLPVAILRPGIVVGEGGGPFHTGLGFYNNEQHCIGWNAGRNPLPFVLVEDVAEAIWLAGQAPGVEGRCYNLVGDVRLSARDYLAALGGALGRPLRFHPQSPRRLWLQEYGKWLLKRIGGRASQAPSLRDLRSRGMMAVMDCADAKRDLGWRPVADPERFFQRAILVHAG